MCTRHYQRWLKNGDPSVLIRQPTPPPNRHFHFTPEIWQKWLVRRNEQGDERSKRLREGIEHMRRMLEARSNAGP
jgi:hypothetical protein